MQLTLHIVSDLTLLHVNSSVVATGIIVGISNGSILQINVLRARARVLIGIILSRLINNTGPPYTMIQLSPVYFLPAPALFPEEPNHCRFLDESSTSRSSTSPNRSSLHSITAHCAWPSPRRCLGKVGVLLCNAPALPGVIVDLASPVYGIPE